MASSQLVIRSDEARALLNLIGSIGLRLGQTILIRFGQWTSIQSYRDSGTENVITMMQIVINILIQTPDDKLSLMNFL